MTSAELLRDLNRDYAALHTTKEDAFWRARMGHGEREAAGRALERADVALQRFLSDGERRRAVARALEEAAEPETRTALAGWLATLEARGVVGEGAEGLSDELVAAEGELLRARGAMELGYVDPGSGELTRASSVALHTTVRSDPDPARREAAWRGLRTIEDHVLAHGFLDVVRRRNALARACGAPDWYEWKARREEGIGTAEIFALLDDLEGRTRDAARRSMERLAAERGPAAAEPWSVRFETGGDVRRELDAWFPLEEAVSRWGRSFAALGIDYRGAELVLDLLDRPGKYENGFMHGPEVAWREGGVFHPARIHFTANAIPGMVGSGQRALATLFHEGGHAAHFANVDMPAPCFGTEGPPTSAATAETQSMFLDSLIGDADWRRRYARTADGEPLSFELHAREVRALQPHAAWDIRILLQVCEVERRLYALPEEELEPGRVLDLCREVERELLFLEEGSPIPTLAIPHLLSADASASYHGYVLADMAVAQTRAFFLERDGHLVDDPAVGPTLRDAYWVPGNSRTFPELVRGLTGAPASAEALAQRVTLDVEEALARDRRAFDAEPGLPRRAGPVELDAAIRVVHGEQPVAELAPGGDFEAFAADFASFVRREASAGRRTD